MQKSMAPLSYPNLQEAFSQLCLLLKYSLFPDVHILVGQATPLNTHTILRGSAGAQTRTGFNFHPTKQGTESLDPFPLVGHLSQTQPVSCYRAELPSPGQSITGGLHHCHEGLQELGKSTGLSVLLLISSGIHCHRNLLSPWSSPNFP